MEPMARIRIVADDLTGALDAAAPFAAAGGPLPVLWQADAALRLPGSFVLDTESREATGPVLDATLPALAEADVALKKIDSLLRGTTASEIAACLLSGRFQSAVIAPAFPAQHRITRGGRQFWRRSEAEPWQAVACDLAGELQAAGVDLRLAARADHVRDGGFFLCDAESEDELAALVAAGGFLAKPLLWVGTAGLARALAGPGRPPAIRHPPRPVLIVIGSHHPVSLDQVSALAALDPRATVRLRQNDDAANALERVHGHLATDGHAGLILSVPDGTGAAVAGPWYGTILEQAAECLTAPAALVVSGGATLMQLARALGAQALGVQGELLPGIPLSILEGGRWSGTPVVSKSGAFGAPDLLVRLVQT